LVLTDKEYDKRVRRELARAVAKEYKIEFHPYGLGGIAEVVPYGE